MMKVQDLYYYVPLNMHCHVYRRTDVELDGARCRGIQEYKNDIFDDYTGGIRFGDLQRYMFVWNADVVFMEPKGNKLYIVINA